MFKGKRKVIFCAFLVGVFLSISAAAYAAVSNWYYINNVYGVSYRNQAICAQTTGGVYAATLIETTTGSGVPEGYMAAVAAMYRASDGSIFSSSDWQWNNDDDHGVYVSLPPDGYVGQYYYSKGLVDVWNGAGYNEYPTYLTANVLRAYKKSFSNSSNDLDYPKNLNGQTYGSSAKATSIETQPDLISAIGVDGTEGYIKSVDLNGVRPKTPEEAKKIMELQSKGPDFRIIPLYAVDGETVIGNFKIYKGYTVTANR